MTDLFNAPADPGVKDYVAELIGDGKKFKTVEDLAKGKYEADLYIKTLEMQKDELRNDYLKLREDATARATLQDLIDKLSNQPPTSDSTPPTAKTEPPVNFDEMFSKKLHEYESTKARDQNTKMVIDALKERHGHSYLDVLNKQTEELGLTKEAVNYLAETSPKALMKQLGLTDFPKTDPFQAPPRTSALFSPKGEQKRTWSYYQKMKKDNPALYFNKNTQTQIHKDYESMGREFEDGDFLTMGQESAF